jgi:hypothetical protein
MEEADVAGVPSWVPSEQSNALSLHCSSFVPASWQVARQQACLQKDGQALARLSLLCSVGQLAVGRLARLPQLRPVTACGTL